MPSPRPRCKKRVFSGARHDMGGHPCGHYALEGSDFCRIHGPQPDPEEMTRDAQEEPETSSRHQTTYYASLEWKPGRGPVVPVPYRKVGTYGVVTRAWASVVDDANPRQSAKVRGIVLKKDGSLGVQGWEADTWLNPTCLPERYLEALWAKLEEERRG